LLAEKHRWESLGHRVVGLIDDHPRFAEGEETHLQLPVYSPAKALAMPELPGVVLSTDTFEDQLWEKTAAFRQRGVGTYRLYGA
jgi:hypothetical protein